MTGWMLMHAPVLADTPSPEVTNETAPQVFYTDNSLETGAISGQPIRSYPQGILTNRIMEVYKIDPDKQYQTMLGVGAAFSEIGTLAFATLPPAQQTELIENLFDPHKGAGFGMCRLPVGANDFANGPYSYDDTPDDYAMEHFTLERDEKSIIPVVQAALKTDPDLKLFASPWSPPGWMKASGTMDKGGKDCHLLDDVKVYQAYALYFQKYLQGYEAHGIHITRLCPQNEMDWPATYPACVMPPETMTKLVVDFLAPQFKSAEITTEIWPGTFREKADKPWARTCLENEKFRAVVAGLGLQYCDGNFVKETLARYPGLGAMYTEAPCGWGKNSAREAQSRLTDILNAASFGCDSYAYWNMLLDEKQSSHWGWKQDSLVTIDTQKHTIRYNADYQPLFLIGKYLRPGSIRIQTNKSTGTPGVTCLNACQAFLRPDGNLLVLAQNRSTGNCRVEFKAGSGHGWTVDIPPTSDLAIVLPMH